MKSYTVEFLKTKDELRINGQLCTIRRGQNVVCIENGSAGIGHTAHPNIDVSGSVSGMKKLGYWRKEDRIIRERGHYYNMSRVSISCELDALAYFIEKGGRLPNIETKHETEQGEKFTFSI